MAGDPSVVRDTSGLLDMESFTPVNIENDETDSFSDGAASLGTEI